MQYFKYFFYLAWNWNLRLACFVLYYEIRGEKKYCQNTIGIDHLKKEISPEVLAHASVYQPVNYYTAAQLFDQTYLEDTQGTLLDLGCGKGRVFGIGAAYGFRHIIGVDFSKNLCAAAALNASETMSKYPELNIEIECVDAAGYPIPTTVTTIFLFNPFDFSIMRKVLQRLKESVALKPRPIKVLYANPVCKKLFTECGFVETFYFKRLTYLEGCVLESE
ncbi:MAG: class I SAM-dependent methyltransferase [Bacteroidota bacterium]